MAPDALPAHVVIQTSGRRHGPVAAEFPPAGRYELQLHNPARDPRMRHRTGQDDDVRHHVLTTPGARAIVLRIVRDVLDQLPAARHSPRLVRVAVVCAGGRHRSVVVAEVVAAILAAMGIGVEVDHRDLGRPVLPPAAGG